MRERASTLKGDGLRWLFHVGLCVIIIGAGTVTNIRESFSEEKGQQQGSAEGLPDDVKCLQAGHEALDDRKLDKAIESFSACAARFPKSTLAQYWLGMAYFFKHDGEKAVEQFKKVLALEPDNVDGLAMLGRIYSFDEKKVNLAEKILQKALKARPDSSDIRFDLARIYAQKGDLKRAFAEFSILFEEEKKYAVFHAELAKILLGGGAKKEAIEQLKRALVILPDYQPARELLKEIEAEKAKEQQEGQKEKKDKEQSPGPKP